MDTSTLVDAQIDDGQRLLDRLGDEGFVVRAAGWVKPIDEDRWSLYIVTPAVDQLGPLEAYRRVLRALRSLDDVGITGSEIKLVGEKHAVAQDLVDLLRRLPASSLARFRPPLLGGIPIDDIRVYAPGKSVEVTVYGLVFRGEPSGGLHLSLEPHNPNSTLTVESNGIRNVYPAETGVDWTVAAPPGATLERDEIGRLVLVWDRNRTKMQADALEVWSMAKHGRNGFRFLREPISLSPAPG
jgi:hypothetical protein